MTPSTRKLCWKCSCTLRSSRETELLWMQRHLTWRMPFQCWTFTFWTKGRSQVSHKPRDISRIPKKTSKAFANASLHLRLFFSFWADICRLTDWRSYCRRLSRLSPTGSLNSVVKSDQATSKLSDFMHCPSAKWPAKNSQFHSTVPHILNILPQA